MEGAPSRRRKRRGIEWGTARRSEEEEAIHTRETSTRRSTDEGPRHPRHDGRAPPPQWRRKRRGKLLTFPASSPSVVSYGKRKETGEGHAHEVEEAVHSSRFLHHRFAASLWPFSAPP